MTKEETKEMWDSIEKLSELRSNYSCFDKEEEPYYRALSLGIKGIKALEQNTVSEEVYNDEYIARKQAEYELWKIKKQEPCEDCISRKAVIDLINADWKYEDLELSINELPPVTPTRKVPREDITEDEVRINMLELAFNQAKEHAESIEVLTDNHRLIFKAEKRGAENE